MSARPDNRTATEGNNVSCLNSKAIIGYFRRNCPERLTDLLAGLGEPWASMPELDAYLSDETNWIPSGLVVTLFQNARAITGNENIAFDIGFDSVLNREYSYWQRIFVRIFGSPEGVLRRLNQLNNRLNTTKVVELIATAPGRAVIRWHWREGVVTSKDICAYNRGIYSALPTIWELPAATVEERTCWFEGGPYCQILFTWSLSKGRFRSVLSNLITRKSTLLTALEEIERDKTLLKEKFDELHRVNQELSQKVTMLRSINDAARTLVSVSDTQLVLQQTLKPIVEVFGYDRALIMMVDDKEEFLEYRYGVGESMDAMEKMKGYRVPLSRDQNLMIRAMRAGKPVLVKDVNAAGLNPANFILADFHPSSFVICPLIAEGKAIGLLGADRRVDRGHLSSTDAESLTIFATTIATAFQRVRMDEELKGSYVNSVRALVQAIEEKDTYTRGHSERVSRMAVEVGKVLGLSDQEINYLRFGGILHDVGKIGIPESIVRSPKPLTEAEFRIIKKHPLKGVEILQPIAFMRSRMHIIRNHHERWDGKGYPDQLAQEEIPLGAQIVAVADAFDAMTSSRPYRRGMPVKQAAREIQRSEGTQFSRTIAQAFREA